MILSAEIKTTGSLFDAKIHFKAKPLSKYMHVKPTFLIDYILRR